MTKKFFHGIVCLSFLFHNFSFLFQKFISTLSIFDSSGNKRIIYYALRLGIRALQGGRTTFKSTASTSDLNSITTQDSNGNLYLLTTNASTNDYTVNEDVSSLYPGSGSTTIYPYDANNSDTSASGPAVTNGQVTFDIPANGAVLLQLGSVASKADTQAPTTPTNLQATAHDDTHVTLSWTASTDNVAVEGYDIYANGVQIGGVDGGTSQVQLPGLSPGTAYTFTVKAWDAAENYSAASNSVSVTTDTATGKYEAEDGVTSDGAYRNYSSVNKDISGQATYSGKGFVEGYWNSTTPADAITVSVASAGSYTLAIRYINVQAWSQTIGIYVNGTRALTATLANGPDWNTWETDSETLSLNAGTNTITIQRDSSDQGNQKFDFIQLSGNGVIAAPVLTTATASNGQVNLAWNSVSGASSYDIYRSLVAGDEASVPNIPLATGVTTTSYTDTTVAAGSTYFYKVLAHVGSGVSSLSNELNVTATGSGTALDRSTWVATASANDSGEGPSRALDGDLNTRWSTGHPMRDGDWFQLDLGSTQTFSKVVLDATNSPNDYLRGYSLYVSNDGSNWGNAVKTGTGSNIITTITFSPQTAHYIKIVQTGSSPYWWWSIAEANVYS